MPIEERVEAIAPADYGQPEMDEKKIARLKHRNFVGGRWEEMGAKQLDFLREQGLRPEDRLLDVGCGSLRAGRYLGDYLEPGHYYGIDVNHSLLVAGYEHELDDRQRARLPQENLRATDRFDADFGVRFDVALAQSVFSHLSLNHLRLCLHRVGQVVRPGGRFFVTFFEQPEDFPIDGVAPMGHKGQFTERNNYWYYRSDMAWATERTPWEFRYHGAWGHPRGQVMAEYVRTGG